MEWSEIGVRFVPHIDATSFGNKNGVCCFNNNILCNEDKCKTCGWNPVIAKRRAKTIKERMARESNG